MSEREPENRRKLLEDALRGLRDARAQLQAADHARREGIAVIGAGVRLPGDVEDLDAFWRLLCDGGDAVSPLVSSVDGRRPRPAARSADDGRWAALLEQIDGFDAEFFGISAAEASRMDPQQRLLLEVAWEAVEDAGLPAERLQEVDTGVFVGLHASDYMTLQLADPGAISAYSAPGTAHSIAANRLSYLLDLRGPSFVVDTACSSSLVAVTLACRALRQGDCDIALVGGVNVILSPLSTLMTEKVLPLAPGGRCRSFDAGAEGIVRGEGCGVLVLERVSRARAAGRRIRGIIRGAAINSDGRTNGLTAPNPRAQANVLRRALADAAADPADVVYVEAHGTGTPLGDPIEAEALCEVYGRGELPCAFGSVKSNLGHLEAAAGITGLIKAMLVLEHRRVPPTLHLQRLNPEIDLRGTRLSVPTALTPLAVGDAPSLGAVSSFGFGGTNAHVVLEAAPAVADEDASPSPLTDLLLPVSARSAPALAELAQRYASRLEGCDGAEASAVCAAAALRRTHHRVRLCASGGTPSELVRQLTIAATAAAHGGPAGEQRVAFVFSGQGAQWPGMGADLLATQPVARQEVEACDALTREAAGWSILEQLQAPAERSRVDETEVAQLTVAALQLGLLALWRSWGIEPDVVAGHSMGEVVAACAAGVLSREDAFGLLLHRARISERAARGGVMANIGLPDADVEPLVAAAGGRVAIAAVNGPRSTVVAGDGDAVDRVVAAAGALGAKTRRLPVRYAFHSPLLAGAAAELEAAIAGLRVQDGNVPLYSTVTGDVVAGARLDASHWGRNLSDAVLLRPAIAALARDGVSAFVEVGPHPVLLRDIGATLEEIGGRHVTAGSLRRNRPAAATLHRSLADLYVAGVDPRWDGVLAAPAATVALPAYPWQRRRRWLTVAPEPAGVADAGTPRVSATEQPALTVVQTPADEATDAPTAERIEALTLYVRERIAEAAGLEDVDDVAADVPLQSAGLNSLAIVELKNQVEREMRIAVPLAALLDGGTPRALARVIADAPGLSDTAADDGAGAAALPTRSLATRLSPDAPARSSHQLEVPQ